MDRKSNRAVSGIVRKRDRAYARLEFNRQYPEVAAARMMGIQPITLGPRILRTETAPIAALAILLAALEGRL